MNKIVIAVCSHFIEVWRQASMEKYPTRSVEYMLAWIIVCWSARLVAPGDVLVGPIYKYHLAIMPEIVWGSIGVFVGLVTLYALFRNGGWEKSPFLRLVGASFSAMWWLSLFLLYSAAVETGAPDFPMRSAYPVLIFFSLYSCYRCGQDHTLMKSPPAQIPVEGVKSNGG